MANELRRRESSVSKLDFCRTSLQNHHWSIWAIVGGAAHGTYRGDYFLDKDEEWHIVNNNAKGSEPRKLDDILIVFYGLEPNYV